MKRQSANRWSPLLLVMITVGLIGCGPKLGEVIGVVTLDGQPLRGGDGVRATVVFQPVASGGVPAVGNVGREGEYRLSSGSQEGVAPGEYAVTCTASQKIVGRDPNAAPIAKRITDPKYANAATSGLQFTVQPGSNEFNIALESN
jgi:hypothetical protein